VREACALAQVRGMRGHSRPRHAGGQVAEWNEPCPGPPRPLETRAPRAHTRAPCTHAHVQTPSASRLPLLPYLVAGVRRPLWPLSPGQGSGHPQFRGCASASNTERSLEGRQNEKGPSSLAVSARPPPSFPSLALRDSRTPKLLLPTRPKLGPALCSGSRTRARQRAPGGGREGKTCFQQKSFARFRDGAAPGTPGAWRRLGWRPSRGALGRDASPEFPLEPGREGQVLLHLSRHSGARIRKTGVDPDLGTSTPT
jgi:hypothetical protein